MVNDVGRKRKNVDYRKLYKEYYGIEFGREMVVHHIDFDRSNNDINNLLLLPNKLHAKYHFALSMLFGIDKTDNLLDGIKLTGRMPTVFYPQWLRIMADTLEEIEPWIRMKVDFEKIPNSIFDAAYHTENPITERSIK